MTFANTCLLILFCCRGKCENPRDMGGIRETPEVFRGYGLVMFVQGGHTMFPECWLVQHTGFEEPLYSHFKNG